MRVTAIAWKIHNNITCRLHDLLVGSQIQTRLIDKSYSSRPIRNYTLPMGNTQSIHQLALTTYMQVYNISIVFSLQPSLVITRQYKNRFTC